MSRAGAPAVQAKLLGGRRPQTMGDLLDMVDELRAAGREAEAMKLALLLQQRHGR